MKKYFIGFLVGAFFTISATAFADDIQSLVGKKVQAEYTVEVNGKVLNTVVVEGKNYAPVRSIGEAAGYEVTIDGKKVIYKEGEVMNTSSVNENKIAEKIANLNTALENAKNKVNETNALISKLKEQSKTADSDKSKKNYESAIAESEMRLAEYQQSVNDIESNIAELQK
ncbi:hypothetical protein BSK62_13115 [Paenibacillus odorifer]|uniref:hypothetical protein n=1 Tax=Paenibacillus odorifer TaxID=189426 RepID=UPI00096ECD6A|nr:hypothetical protein [Paenibacillus odorifer]OMD66002.1 hypothetical protein BSK62_13115 [Paenibacillus odorifer]